MAKRYGQLPSHVWSQGQDIDVIVSEIALGYENYLHEKAENDSKGIPTLGRKHTQSELADMMKATKEHDERKKNEGHNDSEHREDAETIG